MIATIYMKKENQEVESVECEVASIRSASQLYEEWKFVWAEDYAEHWMIINQEKQ